ncbi:uncharacterized protein LOC121430019 [Lytechinus variegatus]|uniref:uncharacterized protein LOC121430019 n=1 Tax=Lytechinus variegatus TaxID=7654 RepID=UPI001BB0E051|nr:uncharacterized protein LOC121430019 [Lytechinus variegatus]
MSTPPSRRLRWSLTRDLSGSSDDDSSSSCLYLVVNGSKARSKRTKATYDHLSGLQRRDDKVLFTMASGKKVWMNANDMDADAVSQEFDITTIEDLETQVQPLLSSTPKTRPSQRKRLRVPNEPRTNQSCKGVVEVPITMITLGNPMKLLIKCNTNRVEMYKQALLDNPNMNIPILPVMTEDEAWDEETAEESQYMLLGGCNLLTAIIDLAGDDKFAHLRRCKVRVHGSLSMGDALHIGALFQQEQGLLVDEAPTLQAKVAVCRRLLYSMHELDEDADEPPAIVQNTWRKRAAAALGCLSSNPKDRKKLETTFQLALYSRRCYVKLERMFELHEEKHGKALKQTVFMHLQGLKEEEKYELLTKTVNGEIQLDNMKSRAKFQKGLHTVQREFQLLTKKRTWDECKRAYPEYTTDSALGQFIGMNFKKSIPREFFNFVQEVMDSPSGTTTSSSLRLCPVSLTVLEVDGTTGIKKVAKDLKEGTTNVVVITDGIMVASRWQEALEREGFSMCQESVIVGDNKARYVIAGTTANLSRGLGNILPEATAFHTILTAFSDAQDSIALAVQDYDAVEEDALTLNRIARNLSICGRSSGSSGSSGSEYDFSEAESAD